MQQSKAAFPYAVKYKGRYYAAGESLAADSGDNTPAAGIAAEESKQEKRKPVRKKAGADA